MKFQVSPTVQIALGIIVTVTTLASKGAINLPVGVPATWGPIIQSWSNFILQIYAPVATGLALYGNSQPGPLAPPDPPAVVAATLASKPK